MLADSMFHTYNTLSSSTVTEHISEKFNHNNEWKNFPKSDKFWRGNMRSVEFFFFLNRVPEKRSRLGKGTDVYILVQGCS